MPSVVTTVNIVTRETVIEAELVVGGVVVVPLEPGLVVGEVADFGVELSEVFDGVEDDGVVDGAVDGAEVGDEDGAVVAGDEVGDVEPALPWDDASVNVDNPLDPALLTMASSR